MPCDIVIWLHTGCCLFGWTLKAEDMRGMVWSIKGTLGQRQRWCWCKKMIMWSQFLKWMKLFQKSKIHPCAVCLSYTFVHICWSGTWIWCVSVTLIAILSTAWAQHLSAIKLVLNVIEHVFYSIQNFLREFWRGFGLTDSIFNRNRWSSFSVTISEHIPDIALLWQFTCTH